MSVQTDCRRECQCTLCRTDALPSFFFSYLVQLSNCLQTPDKMFLFFSLLSYHLLICFHMSRLSLSLHSVFLGFPLLFSVFDMFLSLIFLYLFLSSAFPLIFSALHQFLYCSPSLFRDFLFVRASPHCLLCIYVFDTASNYLKNCLRIWCFARWKEIKFSQWFNIHAKFSCAFQRQSKPQLWNISDFFHIIAERSVLYKIFLLCSLSHTETCFISP